MNLADALAQPLGRAAFLTSDAEAQLLGPGGALASQLAALSAGVGTALGELLTLPVNPLPRRPLPWTLLTEGEHPGWALLALSDPPALSAAGCAQLAAHLAAAPQVVSAAQRRAVAEQAPEKSLPPTWADLLAERSVIQAAQALLSHWGVLAAYVGLNPHHRPRATELLWAELLGKQGAQLTQPLSLASAALWAALWPLHGGLPRPEQSDVVRLATALRQPAEACGPLPPEADLARSLAESLPGLDAAHVAAAARTLRWGNVAGADPGSGVCLSCQPGASAYWLRRRREVQLITCSGPGAAVRNRVWTWEGEGKENVPS